MTVKRLILSGLTLLVTFLISISLLDSWTKPQVQSQLDLYQTNLLLHASTWREEPRGEQTTDRARSVLVGSEPVKEALKQYQQVKTSAEKGWQELVQKSEITSPESKLDVELGSPPVQRSPRENLGQLIDDLDLQMGILSTQTDQTQKALDLWTNLITQPKAQASLKQRVETAQVLLGLWSQPPRILPHAEAQLQNNLKGWFRYQGLAQLYRLQQRQDALAQLEAVEQQTAESALLRLSIVGGLPALGGIVGSILILVWLIRQIMGAVRSSKASVPQRQVSKMSTPTDTGAAATVQASEIEEGEAARANLQPRWAVPWNGETIWQVMIFWFMAFFTVSFIVIPVIVQILGLNPTTFNARTQAYFALFSYGLLMLIGLSLLYLCLKPFLERPIKWLQLHGRGQWVRWGIGGYLAALPLVILVSLLNQQLLKNQGGGNPILEIILQSKDNLTIAILFFMVAVLAPVFEETLFRGFFLTSLTRYLPLWGAIALSGLLFAVAHLNLSDILPLTVLGMILGYVYARSSNLLASMLLHSLWNSGSFLGLLILGSGSN